MVFNVLRFSFEISRTDGWLLLLQNAHSRGELHLLAVVGSMSLIWLILDFFGLRLRLLLDNLDWLRLL